MYIVLNPSPINSNVIPGGPFPLYKRQDKAAKISKN